MRGGRSLVVMLAPVPVRPVASVLSAALVRVRWLVPVVSLVAVLSMVPLASFAHGIAEGDALAVGAARGPQLWVYAYLGAKHMVTGVDHLLFLLCVVGLLTCVREVLAYASLFALGHSVTLVAGTLAGWQVNEHAVDALIGLSIVWKALDNLGAFQVLAGWRPPPRPGVAAFGLVHGLGLASRVQALELPEEHLLAHLLAFNAGVEAGQVLALGAMAGLLAGARAWARALAQRTARPAPALAAPPASLSAYGGRWAPAMHAAPVPVLPPAARLAQLGLYTAGLVLTLDQLGAWSLGR